METWSNEIGNRDKQSAIVRNRNKEDNICVESQLYRKVSSPFFSFWPKWDDPVGFYSASIISTRVVAIEGGDQKYHSGVLYSTGRLSTTNLKYNSKGFHWQEPIILECIHSTCKGATSGTDSNWGAGIWHSGYNDHYLCICVQVPTGWICSTNYSSRGQPSIQVSSSPTCMLLCSFAI